MSNPDLSRRDVLRAGASSLTVGAAIVGATGAVEAASRTVPTEVTVEYNETVIKKYQPQLVLKGIDPEPAGWYALHAKSKESDLNAVYGFTLYSHQSGATSADSHLGDHEPIIVWYHDTTGEVKRVDYAAYHWFRGTAWPDQLTYADSAKRRPMMRVDPQYHHYYNYGGGRAGERLEVLDLLENIDGWLRNGLEDSLATSQPYNPWAMFSRESWWKHTTGNWLDASLKALWFNLGVSDATETADVQEVNTW